MRRDAEGSALEDESSTAFEASIGVYVVTSTVASTFAG